MSNNSRRVADPKLVAKRLPQIINAAIQQFGHRGFHSTTIQDIAKAAGISIGMIYQYVGDKEELLYLSVFAVVEHCLEEVEKALTVAKSPLDRYIAVVEALTRVIDERRAEAVMGYRESHSMSREHMEYVMKREREIGQILVNCIDECIEAGVFRKVNSEMLMYQSVVFAHNWSLNAWRFRHVMTVDEYLREGLGVMLKPVLVDFGTPVLPNPRALTKVGTPPQRSGMRSRPGLRRQRRAAGKTG
jgi:TetR/AcrR family transcriptional regulator, cholesterol catabolism regulator